MNDHFRMTKSGLFVIWSFVIDSSSWFGHSSFRLTPVISYPHVPLPPPRGSRADRAREPGGVCHLRTGARHHRMGDEVVMGTELLVPRGTSFGYWHRRGAGVVRDLMSANDSREPIARCRR